MAYPNAQNLNDIIITGMEGGTYSALGVENPEAWGRACRDAESGVANAFRIVRVYDHAGENEGEAALCDPFHLTSARLRRAFDTLAEQAPRLAGDLLSGDYDVIAADALLQCAAFGKIVYG